MQPTTKILARNAQNSSKNKDEVFTKLFPYLLRLDIYFEAYKHIYANNGAATKGSNDDTIDGFSEKKIAKIIKMLRYEPIFLPQSYGFKLNRSCHMALKDKTSV